MTRHRVALSRRRVRRWVARRGLRPGLRATVLAGSAVVIVALGLAAASSAAGHLRATAERSALDNTESIVRGYVDPILDAGALGIAATPDPETQEQLDRLIGLRDMRRINVYTRDGRILYSTEPGLVGRRMDIDSELADAFTGHPSNEVAARDDADATEATLPKRYMEIYVPIRGTTDGNPIGVFEVYIDAGPIDAAVERTRTDVFLISVGAGGGLLGLLWLGFSGASHRMTAQNRGLSRLNRRLNAVTDDLRHREARFRSLVTNSSDVVAVLDAEGRVSYESDAVRGVLGIDPGDRIGRPFEEHLHPEDAAWVRSVLVTLPALEGRQQSAEIRMRHADGTWRWVSASHRIARATRRSAGSS